MRRKGNIVSYTAEELAAKRANGEDQTDWAEVAKKTEEELAADRASDPAWDDVPEDWVSQARTTTGLATEEKEEKRRVTMRLDADVLEYFKSGGRGWQGHINAVLRSFIERGERR
ncbi:MAG: BrnA antitoxin family protein [Alphaproteobacteria bacterium]|nr:BrnA antitoxin family protein [Alphaproteobacteria bacterium]